MKLQLPVGSGQWAVGSGGRLRANSALPTADRRLPTASAFTFTEILFAVMILGVGLIMIAAALPVAMRQSQVNLEETTGRAVANSGLSYIAAVASEASLPTTPDGVEAHPGLPIHAFNLTRGNRISSSDPRYAWVPLYDRQDDQAPRALCVAIRVRNQQDYTVGMWGTDHDNGPHLVSVEIDGGQIEFNDPDDRGRLVAAEGAYVVLRDGGGIFIRLGAPFDAIQGQWYLWPGSDEDLGGLPYDGEAWIIGRGLRNPLEEYDETTNPYEGPAQDVMLLRETVSW